MANRSKTTSSSKNGKRRQNSSHTQQPDMQRMREVFELFIRDQKNSTDDDGIGNALKGLGLIAVNDENYELANSYLKDSLARYKKAKNPEQILDVLINLTKVSQMVDEPSITANYFLEILRDYRELLEIDIFSNSLMFLSVRELCYGDATKARSYFNDNIDMLIKADDKVLLAQSYMIFGKMCLQLQLGDEGVTNLKKSLAIVKGLKDFEGMLIIHDSLGEEALRSNDIALAKQHYTECFNLSKKIGNLNKHGEALFHLGECAFFEDDYVQAWNYFIPSFEIFSQKENHEGALKSAQGIAHIALINHDIPNMSIYLNASILIAFHIKDLKRTIHALEGFVALYELLNDEISRACILGATQKFLEIMLRDKLLDHREFHFTPLIHKAKMKKKVLLEAWKRGYAMDFYDILDFVAKTNEQFETEEE